MFRAMVLSLALSHTVTGLKINPDPCFTTIYMFELTVLAGFVSTRTFCCFIYNTTSFRTGTLVDMLLGPYNMSLAAI